MGLGCGSGLGDLYDNDFKFRGSNIFSIYVSCQARQNKNSQLSVTLMEKTIIIFFSGLGQK